MRRMNNGLTIRLYGILFNALILATVTDRWVHGWVCGILAMQFIALLSRTSAAAGEK